MRASRRSPCRRETTCVTGIGGIEDYREALSGFSRCAVVAAAMVAGHNGTWVTGMLSAFCVGAPVAALVTSPRGSVASKCGRNHHRHKPLVRGWNHGDEAGQGAVLRQHALLGELADAMPDHVFYRQNWTLIEAIGYRFTGEDSADDPLHLPIGYGGRTAALWDHMSDSTEMIRRLNVDSV